MPKKKKRSKKAPMEHTAKRKAGRPKLPEAEKPTDPMIVQEEKYKHKQAFKFYLELGPERTYQRTSEAMHVSMMSIFKWSKSFKWRDRVLNADLDREELKSVMNNPVPAINEVEGQTQIRSVLNQINTVIAGCFILNEKNVLEPIFSIRHAKDFLDLVKAEKELIQLYIELAGKDDDGRSRAEKEMVNLLGKMTDEQKLAFLSKTVPNAGPIEEGHISENNQESVQDGNGSDAVPQGDEPASSGDES